MEYSRKARYRIRLWAAKLRRKRNLWTLRRRLGSLIDVTSRQLKMIWEQENLEANRKDLLQLPEPMSQESREELERLNLELSRLMLGYSLPLNSSRHQQLLMDLQVACQDMITELPSRR